MNYTMSLSLFAGWLAIALSTDGRQHLADDIGCFSGIIDIDSFEGIFQSLGDIAIIQNRVADLIVEQRIIIDIYGFGK